MYMYIYIYIYMYIYIYIYIYILAHVRGGASRVAAQPSPRELWAFEGRVGARTVDDSWALSPSR